MKKAVFVKMIALVCLGVFLSGHSQAQQEDKSKRPSPPATAKGTIKGATITIDYSSPSVKGRKIFGTGALIPYNSPWRAGAMKPRFFQPVKTLKWKARNWRPASIVYS